MSQKNWKENYGGERMNLISNERSSELLRDLFWGENSHWIIEYRLNSILAVRFDFESNMAVRL